MHPKDFEGSQVLPELETMPEVVDPELEEMGDEPIEEADASVGSSETEELDSGAGVPTGKIHGPPDKKAYWLLPWWKRQAPK